MASAIATIAAEVVTLLNAASTAGAFSQPFTAERSYTPRHDAESSALQVFVIGTAIPSIETIAGDTDATEYVIEIGVFKRVNQADLAEVDEMVELVEEIGAYLCDTTGNIVSGQRISTPEIDPLYDVDKLQNLGVFASRQSVTYRSCVETRPFAPPEPSLTVPGAQVSQPGFATTIDDITLTYAGNFRLDFQVNSTLLATALYSATDATAATIVAALAAGISHTYETVDDETWTVRVRRNGQAAWADTKTIAITFVQP